MEIKCIITDDEPVARNGLRGYIEKVDFLTLVGECEDAMQLNTMLKTTPVDLIFLDIEIPYISGLDLLAGMKGLPQIIIVSAYEQYALKGYEFDVTDYLLKPVSFERFLKAVYKVYNLLNKENDNNIPEHIFIRSDKQLRKINLPDILYIESMENYVIIHTTSGKEITYITLKQMIASLPAPFFIQVHRSYIVNTQHIIAKDGNQLIVGTNKIPVGRNYRNNVFTVILKNKLIPEK